MKKAAIQFRGISYLENYRHHIGNIITDPYEIDFTHNIDLYKENIIQPLFDLGYEVDVYFHTYQSKKLDYFISEFGEVNLILMDFDETIRYNDSSNIWKLEINSLEQIRNVETENDFKYDLVILTRFDYNIIESVSNIFIPYGYVNSITKGDHSLLFINGVDINDIINSYKQNKGKLDHHKFNIVLENNGVNCRPIYINVDDNNHHPFYRNNRNYLTSENHYHKLFDYFDIFDENSIFYGFRYKPNDKI